MFCFSCLKSAIWYEWFKNIKLDIYTHQNFEHLASYLKHNFSMLIQNNGKSFHLAFSKNSTLSQCLYDGKMKQWENPKRNSFFNCSFNF